MQLYKFLFSVILLTFCDGQRTKDKMYEPINGIAACFRRLNGTHQTGCSSNREGSNGILHFVENEKDLDIVLSMNNSLQYIPAIPVKFFHRQLNDKLLEASHINGLLIYEVTEGHISHFTHDQKCPNAQSNIDGTCSVEWNKYGSGLLKQDFPFPLFYLNDQSEVDKLKDCFKKFNNFSYDQHPYRSLCSVELRSFMFAAHDTPTCLRRSQSHVNLNPVKFCDPMGDQNVWSSLFPLGNSSLTPNTIIPSRMKQILVVARMDTASLFHNLDPGAHSSVTGLVTLLSTAELLKRMLPSYKDYNRNVLFIVFNGETFDYIGSQRVVYDIEREEFPNKEFQSAKEQTMPIRFEDIDLVFEINQLSKTGDDKLHVHMLDESQNSNFINILKKHLNVTIHEGVIPPTSIQSFVKHAKTVPPTMVMTDYAKAFQNPFYNSIYDNASNINYTYLNMSEFDNFEIPPESSVQVYLGSVIDGVAESLYEMITNQSYRGNQRANLYYVNELLNCYLENASCAIHRTIRKAHFQQMPLSLYVGVPNAPNAITNFIALTFAFFMGDKIGDGPCSPNVSSHVYYHFNMSDSVSRRNETRCYRIAMNLTEAESPAFLIDDYDWTSGQYSSWSESTWREFNVRMYLKPSRGHELMTLSVGIVVFALSICLTFFVNAKRNILFGEVSTTTRPTNC